MNGMTRSQRRSRRGEQGYVLVMALLVLAVLFIVASSFMSLTRGEDEIASSDRDMIKALNAAEAGVQQAIQSAKAAASISAVLQTSGSAPFANGESYTFTIANDPAESATPTTDANNMILITSTGRTRNATRIIETLAYIPKLPGFPAAIYVPGAEGDSSFSGTSFIVDGHDTDPVTENPTGALTKLGVGAGSVAVRDTIYNALSSAERTRPVFDGTPGDYGGQPSLAMDTTLSSDVVQTMANTYSQFALPGNTASLSAGGSMSVSGTHTYANGSGGGPTASNNQGWGTRDSPAVYKFSGITMADYTANPAVSVPTLNISGNFEGAGILILDGVYLNVSGDFRWEGLIIVTGPKIGFSMGGGGHQKVFGSVLVNERASSRCRAAICDELIILGNPTIKYSQTAIDNASRALGPRYVYWNERGA